MNTPDWLTALAKGVCEGIEFLSLEAPIGCHYRNENDLWEVSIFVSPIEMVGGARDGEWLPTSFSIDIRQTMTLFDSVEAIEFQCQKAESEDALGTHFALLGSHRDRKVWLRVLAASPEQFGVGKLLFCETGQTVNTW